MRIALICNYYIYNYGSVLQSYALQRYLQHLGADVDTIAYIDEATSTKQKIAILFHVKAKRIDVQNLLEKLRISRMIANDKNYAKIISNRKKKFDEFVNSNFQLTPKCRTIADVLQAIKNHEYVILSSDQLWGPEDILRGYHTLQFIPREVKKIAYATSFGVSHVSTYFQKKIRDFIPEFDHVSVREKSGKELIAQICKRDVPVLIDPTMLLGAEEWRNVARQASITGLKGEYIFYYSLGKRKDNVEFVKLLKQEMEAKMVSILHPESYNSPEERIADVYLDGVGPAEFLSLILNAKYIITDSFHASVFSILFRKKFIVIDRYYDSDTMSRNSRIETLLQTFHLEERQCKTHNEQALKVIYKDIDWKNVHIALERARKQSKNYLISAMRK